MEKNEKQSFEQAVTRLDEIVTMLEKGDAQLDKSLALFKEGVKLIEVCSVMLDEAEQSVVQLQKSVSSEPKEYLFDDE